MSARDFLDNAARTRGPGFRIFTEFHEPQDHVERQRLREATG